MCQQHRKKHVVIELIGIVGQERKVDNDLYNGEGLVLVVSWSANCGSMTCSQLAL